MTKHRVVGSIALLWLLPTIAIAATLWRTPNAVLRVGDLGAFTTSATVPGGLLDSAITNVQASGGSVVVEGIYSASRGQVLWVQETTKDGLQLCSPGRPGVCADLAGRFAGQMRSTHLSGSALSNSAWIAWSIAGEIWFVGGGLFCLIAGLIPSDTEAPASTGKQP
jgi:hypothetical protein